MSKVLSSLRLFVATCLKPVALLSLGMFAVSLGLAPQAAAAPAATTTTLAITSLGAPASSVNWKSVVTLTATVQAGTAPVTVGLVDFCDATAAHCTDIHLLGSAQLTSAGTAVLSLTPAVGSHSYKAVFVGTKTDAGSASAAASLNVVGIFPTTSNIELTGTPGDYTLETTVSGTGPSMPTGTVAYLDTSNNNALVATAELGKGIVEPMSLLAMPSPYSPGSYGISVADFNGDGFLDVAFVNSNTVVVLLGNGDGTFSTQVSTPVTFLEGYNAAATVTADFNGDGIPDLAVLDSITQNVFVLLGNGDGTFTPALGSSPVGQYPASMVVADFNRDGIPDLAVVNNGSQTVTILLGNGDGTFTATATSPSTGNDPLGIAAGDFNGDGKPDLVVANWIDQTASVLLGNGDGTFTPAPAIKVSCYPNSVAVADFNGDGKPDLAISGANTLSVWLGNGDGTFKAAPASTLDGLGSSGGAVVGDFNGDGIPDLAMDDLCVGNECGTVSILQGKGDGTFTPASIAPGYAEAAADFTGAGKSDVVSDGPLLVPQLIQKVVLTPDSISPIGGGVHQVVAVYSGDPTNAGSTSAAVAMVGEKLAPAVSLSAAQSQVASGASDTLTATVTGSPFTPGATAVTPTGNVTFYSGVTLLGSSALNASGVATQATTALPFGTDSLTAVYQGDTNYATEVSNPISVKVTKPTATVSLTASATTVNVGQLVTITATVNGTGARPTGTVTFFDGATQLGAVALTAGVAAYPTSALALGPHSITASYSGDSNYAGATSTAVTVTVNALPVPTVKLTVSASTVNIGQSVTLTATLTGSGTKPTGTVTFVDGSNPLNTATLSAGVATFTTTTLPAGSNSIVAEYSGDSNYQAANSSAVAVTVNLLTPTIKLTSSATSIAQGKSITFTATLTGSGAKPTGTVTFLDGATQLSTASLSAGVATYTNTTLAAGSHSITASYSGDGTYAAATSTAVTVTVTAAASVKFTASPATVTVGAPLALKATVTGSAAAPTGTVKFLDGGVALGSATLASGAATLTATGLAAGLHAITVTYSGNGSYAAATSAALSVTVNKAIPAVKLAAPDAPVIAGNTITFTATVAGGSIMPTGKVTIYAGKSALGTVTLNSAGAAALSTANLAPGMEAVTAIYAGDNNYQPETSPAVNLTVSPK
jgi:hypothetical protein